MPVVRHASGLYIEGGIETTEDIETAGRFLGVGSVPVGGIMPFVSASVSIPGWQYCDGSALSRATYSELFAVIGEEYGPGDGSTTFNLPDLRSRVPVGRDVSETEFEELGLSGGEMFHTLTETEMPSHTHIQDAHSHGNSVSASGNHRHTIARAAPGSNAADVRSNNFRTINTSDSPWGESELGGNHIHTVTINNATATNQSTGGDGSHNNLQPYLVVQYIIYTGVD